MRKLQFILVIILALGACKDEKKPSGTTTSNKKEFKLAFDKDSAYSFVQRQVDFGPRVPGSKAHAATLVYLRDKLKTYADTVVVQTGSMKDGSGQPVAINNIIASFNPGKNKRILLCAHWDTRPQADEDPDEPNKPADGANDGGSGVGVLMEVARQLQKQRPDAGVDIILFDAEDMGQRQGNFKSWCLGSQYWAAEANKNGYIARFGILLDMVGAPNAKFAYEGHSMQYAQPYVKKVWKAANELGHSNYFVTSAGGSVTDDHYFINTIRGIPTLDIIQHDNTTSTGFGHYWHTQKDNMSGIDKNTLQAVGETVFKVVQEF